MPRDFHLPGRSPTMACDGMAATSHPLASQAAVECLRAGGNAADAAVTAVAVLSVVEPGMTGIGGDCFCLVAKPGAEPWGYNGSGRAGSGASAEKLSAQGIRAIAADSPHAVTVPGSVDAWAAILKRHGTMGLDRVLQPAIRYAEQSFPVAPRVAYDWAMFAPKLKASPGGACHYLLNGKAPAEGERLSFPALAETLRAIAAKGPRALYEGAIADDIAQTVTALGGSLTVADLAAHRGEEVRPISTNYRGLDVVEIPPNGQGLTALVLLNMLECFDPAGVDPLSAERFHIALEAARIAYAVRDTHIAEPAAMRVTVEALLEKKFAASLAAQVDRTRRVPLPLALSPGNDTTYLTVVDRDRMAVSLINSLFSGFGTGIATEKTGVLLQNRGSGFVIDPAHPNCIEPNKRPMHTIIPALAMRNGRCEMAFGIMGGAYQASGHAQFVTNVVDYGMDVQAAIDLTRVFYEGEQTVIERSLPAETIAGLKSRGHDIAVRPVALGGGQAVKIDWERGVLIGGSDARKDGCALGF